jgi:peptidoglycan/LPS O-acetylase OafA/YrhL
MLPPVLAVIVKLKQLSSIGLALLVWIVGMLGVGALLMNWSIGSGIARQAGFMSDWTFVMHRTIFGYILDFSVGIFAAVLLIRRERPYDVNISTILSIVGIAGLISFQVLMSQHQDPFALKLLAYGAAICIGILILSLTCETTFLSRALSWSPLVYLGRISYAVYLLQLTQLVWFMSDWHPLLFYAGTTIISAGLYQFFEEPVRRLILRKPKPQRPILRPETNLAR